MRIAPSPDAPGVETDIDDTKPVVDILGGKAPWLVAERVAVRLDGLMAVVVDRAAPARELLTLPSSFALRHVLHVGEAARRAWYEGFAAGKADGQPDQLEAGRVMGYDTGHAEGYAAGRADLQQELAMLLGVSSADLSLEDKNDP